jgi:hypothetical protein
VDAAVDLRTMTDLWRFTAGLVSVNIAVMVILACWVGRVADKLDALAKPAPDPDDAYHS